MACRRQRTRRWLYPAMSVLVAACVWLGCAGNSSDGSEAPRAMGGTGGTSTRNDASDAARTTLLRCPADEPVEAEPCEQQGSCEYATCSDPANVSGWWCRGGAWVHARACPPLVCPTTRPGFLSDCTPLEGLECPYVEDCCGTSQTVTARCTNGVWKLYGAGRSACSVCTTAHSDGEACNLPADCAHASCFVTSCYGQPLVEDCIDGVWRVATTCSK
jgi:hypothetical protein